MSPLAGPSPRLPPGWHEIQSALREADAQAASRRELARGLGVSTHTIQKILVSGEVPEFPGGASLRQTRAWARSLARLAHRLGADPRRWIESVGIVWDEGIGGAVDEALETVRSHAGASSPDAERGSSVLRRIRSRVEQGDLAPVAVAIADVPPFSRPGPGNSPSFFHELARRLVSSVDPEWRIADRLVSCRALSGEMHAQTGEVDLGIGILATPRLHLEGLAALPLPGLHLEMAALRLAPPDRASPAPTWDELCETPGGRSPLVLVEEGGAAWAYLRGLCAFPSGRLLSRRDGRPDRLAVSLREESRARGLGSVLFVGTESAVGRVRGLLERDEDHGRDFVAVPLEGRFPRYPLGLAFPPGAARWREILAAVLEEELFGASILPTARLWARLLRTASSVAGTGSAWRASSFPLATREFQIELCHELLRGLKRDILAERAGAGLDDSVSREVVLRARDVLPGAWHGTLLDVVMGEGPAEGVAEEILSRAPRHCESCATPLVKGARGASDRFCRWCSDERGRLRPREEVHLILADWFRSWKPDLTRTEAVSRAARLMDAMPAWSPN